MGGNGYLEIPYQDVNRGRLTAYVRWGFSQNPYASFSNDVSVVVNWPVPFPNGCLFALATIVRSATEASSNDEVTIQVASLGAASGTFEYNDINGLYTIKNSVIPGFYWLAIGF